jgi:protein-tyrosine phosphatase
MIPEEKEERLIFRNTPGPMNADCQRVLPFRGIANFRDLGGYPAADGKRVKWGILYRSGHLAKATSSDLNTLQALNIETVIDFRSAQEKEKEPDRLPNTGSIKTLALPMLDVVNEAMSKEIHAVVENKNYHDFDPDQKMMAMYQLIASEYAAEYQLFMQTILAAEGKPVLWHCTAGKDRTGFGAAILLRLLGVSHQVILEDYLLSNKYAAKRRSLILFLRLTKGKEIIKIAKKMMSVDKTWIQAAFHAVDQQWGSFENYAKEGLALSPADIAQLRATLLVGAG